MSHPYNSCRRIRTSSNTTATPYTPEAGTLLSLFMRGLLQLQLFLALWHLRLLLLLRHAATTPATTRYNAVTTPNLLIFCQQAEGLHILAVLWPSTTRQVGGHDLSAARIALAWLSCAAFQGFSGTVQTGFLGLVDRRGARDRLYGILHLATTRSSEAR